MEVRRLVAFFQRGSGVGRLKTTNVIRGSRGRSLQKILKFLRFERVKRNCKIYLNIYDPAIICFINLFTLQKIANIYIFLVKNLVFSQRALQRFKYFVSLIY